MSKPPQPRLFRALKNRGLCFSKAYHEDLPIFHPRLAFFRALKIGCFASAKLTTNTFQYFAPASPFFAPLKPRALPWQSLPRTPSNMGLSHPASSFSRPQNRELCLSKAFHKSSQHEQPFHSQSFPQNASQHEQTFHSQSLPRTPPTMSKPPQPRLFRALKIASFALALP